jgi:high affinity Mn2+ porin
MKRLALFILPLLHFLVLFSPELFSQTDIKGFSQDDARGLHFKWKADSIEKWSFHFQLTSIAQGHPAFNAKYSGTNSLHDTAESALSLTTTIFLGRKLWQGGAVYFDPEISGGKGMSYALGMAGAANGETYRIGNPQPTLYVGRFYYQQIIAVGNSKTVLQDGIKNQLGDRIPDSRIVITAGKFSLADYFDDNNYSHDPRTQFMNWALMSNGAWDYPANTRGYTEGFVVELIHSTWAARISSVLEPKIANAETMDMNIAHANGETAELEKSTKVGSHSGTIRLLGFRNNTRAINYRTAINQMAKGGGDSSAVVQVIMGHTAGTSINGLKYGFGLSYDQELANELGFFSRLGWNDGQTSSFAFTEIDHSATAGISVKMNKIKRPMDAFGLACIVNGISNAHRDYLNAGGYGFIIGDGKLTNYGLEQILETYYCARLAKTLWLTLDYQFVVNPAYNMDRGPVNIFGARVHVDF